MNRKLPRPTYPQVMSTLAVFIALGGASYAALKPPANSVGPKQIKANAVRSAEVKNKALKLADLNPATISALQGATGPQGPAGAAGGAVAWQSAKVAADETITATGGFGPFVDLTTPGPSVTVDVPASGLVELYAQVHSSGPVTGTGGVGLAVDGATNRVACTFDGFLFFTVASNDADWATAPRQGGGANNCGTRLPGLAGSVLLSLPPGSHTFKLVYAADSSSGSSTVHFSDRRLFVAPRP